MNIQYKWLYSIQIKNFKKVLWHRNIDVSQCNYVAFIYNAFYASNKTYVHHRTGYNFKVHLSQHCSFFPDLLTCSLQNPSSILTQIIQTLQNYYMYKLWMLTWLHESSLKTIILNIPLSISSGWLNKSPATGDFRIHISIHLVFHWPIGGASNKVWFGT